MRQDGFMGLHAPGPWQLTSPRSPTFLSGVLRARSGLQSHRVDVNSSLCVLKRERSQLLVVFHGVEFVWESLPVQSQQSPCT